MVLLAGVVSAGAVVLAARLAPYIAGKQAHRTKIAEFRQDWINAFREDVASFLTASDRYRRSLNQPVQFGVAGDPSVTGRERRGIEDELILAYHRMYLRINPLPNDNEEEDTAFLEALARVLTNNEHTPHETWQECRKDVVDRGRALLKREWERAKKGK